MSCVQFYLLFRRASLLKHTTCSTYHTALSRPLQCVSPPALSLSLPVSLATRHFTLRISITTTHDHTGHIIYVQSSLVRLHRLRVIR